MLVKWPLVSFQRQKWKYRKHNSYNIETEHLWFVISESDEFFVLVDMYQALTKKSVLVSPVVDVSSITCLYFKYLLDTMYSTLHLRLDSSEKPIAYLNYFDGYHISQNWTRTAVALPNGIYSVSFVVEGAWVRVGLKDVRLQSDHCDYSGKCRL